MTAMLRSAANISWRRAANPLMREALFVDLADGNLSLVRLAEAHREGLRAACAADTEIWQLYPIRYDGDFFDRSFDALVGHKSRMPYAISVDDTVTGMTAWLRPDWTAQTVEIGNSFISPDTRGTGLNGRIKRLMLDHAFTNGIRRVEFRIDERNGRSQAAVLKLGAVKEGVLRAERVTWTGHIRDTGLFSLLAEEWQARAPSAMVQASAGKDTP
jgi:RimJ/RimL family protein N-acetyltransferase